VLKTGGVHVENGWLVSKTGGCWSQKRVVGVENRWIGVKNRWLVLKRGGWCLKQAVRCTKWVVGAENGQLVSERDCGPKRAAVG